MFGKKYVVKENDIVITSISGASYFNYLEPTSNKLPLVIIFGYNDNNDGKYCEDCNCDEPDKKCCYNIADQKFLKLLKNLTYKGIVKFVIQTSNKNPLPEQIDSNFHDFVDSRISNVYEDNVEPFNGKASLVIYFINQKNAEGLKKQLYAQAKAQKAEYIKKENIRVMKDRCLKINFLLNLSEEIEKRSPAVPVAVPAAKPIIKISQSSRKLIAKPPKTPLPRKRTGGNDDYQMYLNYCF